MKREEIDTALNEIRDAYVVEAATVKRPRKRTLWWSACAAILAFAVTLGFLLKPMTIVADAVSLAEYPEYERTYYSDMPEIAKGLTDFFKDTIGQILSDSSGENQTYSPINLYMALSVLAEMAAGSSQEQLLDLLGVSDLALLGEQTNRIWNACYRDTKEKTVLANSLWLREGLGYNQTVMDRLAENYYTSVYQADFSDARTADDIRAWLGEHTGGLLKKEVSQAAQLNADTLFALYSTVYFRAMWSQNYEFNASDNTKNVFHTLSGDITCTFMNQERQTMNYYWAPDCSAISIPLKGGSSMWFILPDEGVTVDDVLASGSYMDLLVNKYEEGFSGVKYMMVNLSIPKFDLRWSNDLAEDLIALGVSDVFSPILADFSSSLEANAYATGVNQATRVMIDEEGVTAASYIEIPGATSAEPPDEIVDFVVDRPFLFIIENSYGIPLFAGVVNNPEK